MTEFNKIINEIKRLQDISPDAEFASLSKSMITSLPQNPKPNFFHTHFLNLTISFATTLALTLTVVIMGSLRTTPTPQSPELSAVEEEATTITQNIDASLNEISQYKESARKTDLALNEVTSINPTHLNTTILNEEINQIQKVDSSSGSQINNLLNEALK